MLEWITDIMHSLGYVGIGLLMFLENLFPHPLRTDYAAGRVHSEGRARQFAPVVAAGVVGTVLGMP